MFVLGFAFFAWQAIAASEGQLPWYGHIILSFMGTAIIVGGIGLLAKERNRE